MPSLKKVFLVKPRGFCAGVVRAIDIVEAALSIYPPPIYVRKEIVHNRHVVEELKSKGAVFVDSLDQVPSEALVIFSAHGVSPEVRKRAKGRGLRVIDATCPLVTKVHLEALRYEREGYSIILIGHKGHEEIEGTMGEAPYATQLVSEPSDVGKIEVKDPEKVVYLTQTTLSVDDVKDIVNALRERFPKLTSPPKDDICYATQNRQSAVKDLAQRAPVILVVGAENSSNSQRLREVACAAGAKSYLINDYTEIREEWLGTAEAVGITAGASAPEELVAQVVEYCRSLGADEVEELETIQEDVVFALPQELVQSPLNNPGNN
ncbi:MAG: 4-hydroxy-3-methylbut-2-enyl diphosphate reductase [Armatimonadetes bacterium]|nr:4-hydroxy-3-methylbut-2-enyl diphosphate reductase [Armatimonadota bacterium]